MTGLGGCIVNCNTWLQVSRWFENYGEWTYMAQLYSLMSSKVVLRKVSVNSMKYLVWMLFSSQMD